LSDHQLDCVRHIQTSGEALLDVISNVLDLSAKDSVNAEDGRSAIVGVPLKILVVEDNPINQLVVQNILRKFDADYVVNGAEALQKVQDEQYDLVFMDFQMPVMDGCEATVEIRKLGHKLPIVAMTASVMDADRQACFDAGMDGFLAKPLSKDKVMAAIRRFTETSRAQAPL
jgi:CheY-like chemotaxis protein